MPGFDGGGKTYGILEFPATVTSIGCIHKPGFEFEKGNANALTRFGFKPTDAVYLLEVQPDDLVTMKIVFATIESLSNVGKEYGLSKPEELVGREVVCRVSPGYSHYNGLIERIEPKI